MDDVESLLTSLVEKAKGQKFDLSQLGRFGFGRVAYTRGPQAWRLWQGSAGATRGEVPRGRSGQLFTADNRVVNYAETAGAEVTACGTWEVKSDTQVAYPLAVNAYVEGGSLEGKGWQLSLPFIRGKGQFEVLHADASCRVFRSGAALVVQLPDESPRVVTDTVCAPLTTEQLATEEASLLVGLWRDDALMHVLAVALAGIAVGALVCSIVVRRCWKFRVSAGPLFG